MSEFARYVIQFVVGVGAILTSFQRGPIFYRFTKIPVPNQRLARAAFFIGGAVLILGGLWSLWLTRHP